MGEEWRDIPGYEGRYQVSDLGRVRMLPTRMRFVTKTGGEAFRMTKERIVAQQMQNSGYMLVHLYRDKQRKALTVHRLVARVFVPGDDENVNHKDGDKTNNRAKNLEWLSYTENHLHAVHIGLNKQAIAVIATHSDGVVVRIDSLAQASRASSMAIHTIQGYARNGKPDRNGTRWAFA